MDIKIKRSLITWILVFSLVVSMLPQVAFANTEDEKEPTPKAPVKIENLSEKDVIKSEKTETTTTYDMGDGLNGWWSRRIDAKNRFVYRLNDNHTIEISQCKGHYKDK